jgi:hypothetical protein
MHAYCRHAHGVQRAAPARLSKAVCSGCTPFFLGVRTPEGRAAIKPRVTSGKSTEEIERSAKLFQ